MMEHVQEPKIFISHSSIDRSVVDALIKLLVLSISGLDRRDIRYTSRAATGLSSGDWIAHRLISDIRHSTCFIAVVSDSYLSSRYCLWELGVRLGASNSNLAAVYLPGINPDNLGDVFADMHLLTLAQEESVQRLIDEVANTSENWTQDSTLSDIKDFCDQAKSHPPNPIETWRRSLIRFEEGHVFLNAYGLAKNLARRHLFQNFHPAGANIQPVQYLWADPRRGNSIRAQLLPSTEASKSFLRIFFDNVPNSFGCNFAVRPLNRQAALTEGAQAIIITARVPEDSEIQEIGIRIRLVNGYMQHWQSTSAEVLCVRGDEFKDFSLDLDPSCWAIFDQDGTADAGPTQQVDFSIISSIVLSVGGYERLAPEPTSGQGILDLRAIEIR